MSPDWDEPKGHSQDSSDGVDPNMPKSEDIASDGEDFKSALGETLEPEKQECENCRKMNSLQDFYCSSCKKKTRNARRNTDAKRKADLQHNGKRTR
jgi:hypothetical protein